MIFDQQFKREIKYIVIYLQILFKLIIHIQFMYNLYTIYIQFIYNLYLLITRGKESAGEFEL
jgi:hypothetical protein